MKAVDNIILAEQLREVLDLKIKKCRKELFDTYMPIEVERIQAQIMACQWVRAWIQNIVINISNNESKEDTKIRI